MAVRLLSFSHREPGAQVLFFGKNTLGGMKSRMNQREELLEAKVTYACVLRGPYRVFLELEKQLSQLAECKLVYAKASIGKLRICPDPGEAANDGNSRE